MSGEHRFARVAVPYSQLWLQEATPDDGPLLLAIVQAAFEEYRGRLTPPSGAHSETAAKLESALAREQAILAGLAVTQHTHHVHIFGAGHPEIDRHLRFRDFLASHPERALAYSDLKRELAVAYPADIDGYVAGKDALIQRLQEEARAWQGRTVHT